MHALLPAASLLARTVEGHALVIFVNFLHDCKPLHALGEVVKGFVLDLVANEDEIVENLRLASVTHLLLSFPKRQSSQRFDFPTNYAERGLNHGSMPKNSAKIELKI